MVAAINSGRARLGRSMSLLEQHTADRLKFLESTGLAEPADPNTWRVRHDFENILRPMQRSEDRQKMLAAHGVLMSDVRLPTRVKSRFCSVGELRSPHHRVGRGPKAL